MASVCATIIEKLMYIKKTGVSARVVVLAAPRNTATSQAVNDTDAMNAAAPFRAYVWQRQTIAQLAEQECRSHVWIRKQLDAAGMDDPHILIPAATPIAADMTFWGRGYGVIVFRSPTMRQNLWWHESGIETPWVYAEGLTRLPARRLGHYQCCGGRQTRCC